MRPGTKISSVGVRSARSLTAAVAIGSTLLVSSLAHAQNTAQPNASDQVGQPAPAPASPEPVRKTSEWNIEKSTRLAIDGYDPVAYFPEGGGKAIKGEKDITVDYKGVVYRFANQKHKDLFLASPSRYEPVSGGWCAWAMQEGDKVEVDPKSFIVKDGRLFLFYNGFLADTRAKWLKGDHSAEATKVDSQWKKISGEDARKDVPAPNESSATPPKP